MKAFLPISICLALTVGTTACLKTRAQLKGDPAEAEAAAQPVPAEVQPVQPQDGYVIDEIKSELTRLTGRIEDMERARQQAKDNPAPNDQEEVKKLETRLIELEQAQASILETLKKYQSAMPAIEDRDAYERGKEQYQSKSYEEAVESFNTYLKNPKAKHLETATYYRGESYFALKQYKKAIIDFSKFPEKFSRSSKLPSALYKIGQSFEALGMKEDAKGFYQELVDKYPKSPEAKLVKAKHK